MAGKPLIDGCFRVSIGTTSQMQRFMEAYLRLDRERLLLLATGGTIAGIGCHPLNDYTAGVLGGDALLAAVPQPQDLATISVEQIANVDSADLLFAHWRALVERIRAALAADPELAGW